MAAIVAVLMVLSACGSVETTEAESAAEQDETSTELIFAHSYGTGHPHHRCGAEVVADKLDQADVGLEIAIFPNSQLGADSDRATSVMAGDIDLDLQGTPGLGATYGPIDVLDVAYAFDGPDHLFDFLDSEVADQLKQGLLEETGARVVDAWYFGMRHFTSNAPIRTPADFAGLRMRFPDTPRFLANAEAIGARATAVAFEEVYLSLQQGVIDGQENPIPTIADLNLPEIQSHLSLTGHMTSFQLVIVSEQTWEELSSEQQDALVTALRETRAENRQCIEDDENKFLEEWRESGDIEIVDDVDRAAFQQLAEEYYLDRLDGFELDIYSAIRATAP